MAKGKEILANRCITCFLTMVISVQKVQKLYVQYMYCNIGLMLLSSFRLLCFRKKKEMATEHDRNSYDPQDIEGNKASKNLNKKRLKPISPMLVMNYNANTNAT